MDMLKTGVWAMSEGKLHAALMERVEIKVHFKWKLRYMLVEWLFGTPRFLFSVFPTL